MGQWGTCLILCTIIAVEIAILVRVMRKDLPSIIVDGTVEPGFEEVLVAFR